MALLMTAATINSEIVSVDNLVRFLVYAAYSYKIGDIPTSFAPRIQNLVGGSIQALKALDTPSEVLTAWRAFARRFAVLTAEGKKGNIERYFKPLLKDLYSEWKQITSDPRVSLVHKDLINAAVLFMAKDSENAKNKIYAKVGMLGDPHLSSLFIKKKGDVSSNPLQVEKRLLDAIQNLTGKSSTKIPDIDVLKQFSEKKPEAYAEFLLARRASAALYKEAIMALMRKTNTTTQSISALRKMLERNKIRHYLPDGLDVLVDENLNMYNKAGKILQGKVPSVNSTITMNPNYKVNEDNAYVFKVQVPGGVAINQVSTLDRVGSLRKHKFEKVAAIGKSGIAKLRKKWQRYITNRDDNIKFSAIIAELIYLTSARIGSSTDTETKGEQTYGIRTLLRKHVKLLPGKIAFDYRSVKGAHNKFLIPVGSDAALKKIYTILEEHIKGLKPNDRLFDVTYTSVTKFFKTIHPKLTPKIFRTLHGTELAEELLKKSPIKKGASQSEADSWLKTEIVKVGAKLGHYSKSGETVHIPYSTALLNYIDPTLIQNWYKSLGLRIIKMLDDKL